MVIHTRVSTKPSCLGSIPIILPLAFKEDFSTVNMIKNNKLSIVFSLLVILVAIASIIVDLYFYDGAHWFQRAGALIVLAGAGLQYSAILTNWSNAKSREKEMLGFDEKIAAGKGVGVKEMYEDLAKTRNFSLEIHGLITEKSNKQTFAILFIIIGTVIWGYGDLPFK